MRASAAVDSDSDDAPLISRINGKVAKKPPRASDAQIGDSSDSDAPLGKKLANEKQKIERAAEKEAVAIRKDEKKPVSASASKGAVAKKKVKKEESSDDDVPLAKKALSKTKKVKAESSTPQKKAKGKAVKKEESADAEEGEDEYRWWEDPTKGDGTNKWETLEHAGVVFPPEYVPLPKHVKMKYDGKPISMHPDAEEVAGFFGAMLNSTHNVENKTFQNNFFGDFKDILKKTGGAKDSSGGDCIH